MRLLPDLVDHPSNLFFADQEEDEEIELFLRAHWITNLAWLVLALALLFIPGVLTAVLGAAGLNLVNTLPTSLSFSLNILWLMLVVAYVVEKFLQWYFNIYIVTNQHLVDINFHNLLSRDKVEIRLEDIQSSKPSVKGVLRSLFNFGDIIIETAAEKQRVEFHDVPRPDLVAERIQDLQHLQEVKTHEKGDDGVS